MTNSVVKSSSQVKSLHKRQQQRRTNIRPRVENNRVTTSWSFEADTTMNRIVALASILILTAHHVLSFSPLQHNVRRPTLMRASSKPFFVDIADSKTNENEQCHNDKTTKTVLVAGATGYIGRAVVSECVQQGYNTVALVRNATYITSTADGRERYADSFQGAQLVETDVEDAAALTSLIAQVADESGKPVESIISCLASPTGTRREAYAIDYQATLNCLQAGRDERVQAKHFVLLSAFCCRNPLLQLQQAKLKFESEMAAQSDMTWTSVRPTAFFKSVSGQLEAIRGGAPYVLFGDGAVTQCNPIAESELAEYMVNTITDPSKHGKILNIGGPDEPLTNQMLGNMMYQSLGMEPKFVYAPTSLFDPIINTLQWIADKTGEEKWQDAAETVSGALECEKCWLCSRTLYLTYLSPYSSFLLLYSGTHWEILCR